ncbi:hypothetical protein JCM15519_36120 [Fundidesulfovibrio butyratiphilus]
MTSKTISRQIRCLHRDIGFLLIGITLLYAVSGIILVYRETDFMKTSKSVSTTLAQDMTPEELAQALHMRRFKATKSDGDTILFQDGQNIKDGAYDKRTGNVTYTVMQFNAAIAPLIRLHMLSSSKTAHIYSVAYGTLLTFLAVSSLFMFNTRQTAFRRGLKLSGIGLVLSVFILLSV